ncbi:MAG: hypothetical protein AAFW65_09135 [Pseudomonadota bacterium]
MDLAIFTLLHILVLVYWLGGDLGAFYASRFLTAPDVPTDRRLFAAKIVNDVDMAPRTALILAFPTGFLLAQSTGWIGGSPVWGWAALALGLVWLALAWALHLNHGAGGWMKMVDTVVRWLAIAALAGAALGAFSGSLALPAFLAVKFLLLAAAIFTGLMIRIVLKPLGPALVGLAGSEPAEAEAALATTLKRARPLVMIIWALIVSAAFVGLQPALFNGA